MHIAELRGASVVHPNWQEQLQNASEGAHGGIMRSQRGIHLENPAGGWMKNDDNPIIDAALLPQEPPGVETDRTQLPFRSATAFPGSNLSHMPYLPIPINNQFGPAPATMSTRGHMAPFGRQALSEMLPTNPNTPAVVHDAAVLNYLGRHDYDFQALTEHYSDVLNFTAVEIITFLPTLFYNSSIARRFVNNGMDNPTHAEIIARHRVLTVDVSIIAKQYLHALRPVGSCSMTGEQGKTLWSRKTQKIPDGWDARNISMNAFVPDRIAIAGVHAPAPASVPFRILSEGVKKMPTGNDAADLTRAIEFANGDQAKESFPGRNLMFPDDLTNILTNIGHTSITEQHRDRAVVGRYRKLYKETLSSKKNAIGKSKGTDRAKGSKSWQDAVNSVPGEMSSPLLESAPRTPPRTPEITRSSVLNHITDTPHSVTQFKQASESTSPNQISASASPLTLTSLGKLCEDEGHVKSHRLLRDLDLEALSNKDASIEASIEASMESYHLASAIRYARRLSQKDVAWQDNPEEIAHINRALQHELEAELRPSDEQAVWEQYWDRTEGKRQREMDDNITTLQQDLGLQVSPPRFTADDYEDLFGEPAPEYLLHTVTDFEEFFEVSSSGSAMQIDSGESG
jgi:hypothetical protein